MNAIYSVYKWFQLKQVWLNIHVQYGNDTLYFGTADWVLK